MRKQCFHKENKLIRQNGNGNMVPIEGMLNYTQYSTVLLCFVWGFTPI